MKSESKILNSVSSAMLMLGSLIVLSSFVGFSLASFSALRYSFLALLILHAVRPLRRLGVVAVVACIGIISWEWVSALYRAFAASHSAFETGYLIALALAFSLIFLGVFAYALIFSLGWCLPKKVEAIADKPEEDRGAASEQAQLFNEEQTANFDPFQILDVERDASSQEIHCAYKKQMQLYHPDRVNHLGPELQQTAHKQTILIQRAFEELGLN